MPSTSTFPEDPDEFQGTGSHQIRQVLSKDCQGEMDGANLIGRPDRNQKPNQTVCNKRYGRRDKDGLRPGQPLLLLTLPSTASRSSDELNKEFGISGSTIERVRSIMEQGTPEQIQSIRQELLKPEAKHPYNLRAAGEANLKLVMLEAACGHAHLHRGGLKYLNTSTHS